jgi:hypothetical protein
MKATETEAAREHAANAGRERPEAAWILSPFDTWEPNPNYCGPEVPHPDSIIPEWQIQE